MKKPSFEYKNCVNCGICAQCCPLSCITMTKYGKQGKYKNVFPELTSDKCAGCGICEKSCPMGVIKVR